jgi:hypothetical protein
MAWGVAFGNVGTTSISNDPLERFDPHHFRKCSMKMIYRHSQAVNRAGLKRQGAAENFGASMRI